MQNAKKDFSQDTIDSSEALPRRVRTKKLPFARPDITREEMDAVQRVLASGWLTSGPEVEKFEREFAARVGARHALAVNSATAALHLGLIAHNIGADDAVLIPSITFTATAEIVTYSGALPLILDVDRKDYLLSPRLIADFIHTQCHVKAGVLVHTNSNRNIRAMIPVHLGGRPCDLGGLKELADRYRLHIVEDAAHAFPAAYEDKMIGAVSEITAFSFYATKNLATGEGGMLTTDDAKIAERLRKVRLHGIQGQTYGRKRWKYDVVDQGYKYNMNDMSGALGRVQLKRTDEMLAKRKKISALYREGLAGLPGIKLPPVSPHQESYHLFTIEVDPSTGIGRDRFVEELYARNISTSLHFIPLYRHSYYRDSYNLKTRDYPNSEAIYDRIVSLPLYSAMSEEDTLDVIYAIKETVQ